VFPNKKRDVVCSSRGIKKTCMCRVHSRYVPTYGNVQIGELALLWKMSPTKKLTTFLHHFDTFPAHHGASDFGFHCRHRSSCAQTKGADLIYGLLVMSRALGLVKFCTGDEW